MANQVALNGINWKIWLELNGKTMQEALKQAQWINSMGWRRWAVGHFGQVTKDLLKKAIQLTHAR